MKYKKKKKRVCNFTLDPNEMQKKKQKQKTRVQFYIRSKLDYKKTVCNFTLDPNGKKNEKKKECAILH